MLAETVTVTGSPHVNQTGIAFKHRRTRISLPWQEISGTQVHHGYVSIYQQGANTPVANAELSNPNAVLIPRLFATIQTTVLG